MMKMKTAIIMVIILMVCPLMVSAQEKEAGNMEFVVEKVRADKKLFVAQNMKLTEAESKAFWPIYENFQDELFLLRARTLKLIDDYSKVYENTSDESASFLLDEFMIVKTLSPKLLRAYLPKFQKALPPVKILRYYQLESKIEASFMYQLAAQIPIVK